MNGNASDGPCNAVHVARYYELAARRHQSVCEGLPPISHSGCCGSVENAGGLLIFGHRAHVDPASPLWASCACAEADDAASLRHPVARLLPRPARSARDDPTTRTVQSGHRDRGHREVGRADREHRAFQRVALRYDDRTYVRCILRTTAYVEDVDSVSRES